MDVPPVKGDDERITRRLQVSTDFSCTMTNRKIAVRMAAIRTRDIQNKTLITLRLRPLYCQEEDAADFPVTDEGNEFLNKSRSCEAKTR